MGNDTQLKKMIEQLRAAFKDKPVEFVKAFAGITPLPYQEKFLLDRSKRQLFVAGRRCGKSLITAMKALHFAWTRPHVMVLIVSASKDQAAETFAYIRDTVQKSKILDYTVTRITQTTIEFDNGSRIKVVASGVEGKSVRGYTADVVIIDEAAFVPDDLFTAIELNIATNRSAITGREDERYLIMISSPGEPTGRFYEAYKMAKEWEELPDDKKKGDPPWSLHHATIFENPYVDRDYIENFEREHSESEVKRELYGEFVSLDETFFDITAVNNVSILKPRNKPDPNYDYYAGLDIAYRGDDYTVLVLVGVHKIDRNKVEMHAYYRIKKKPPTYIAGWVQKYIEKWKPVRVFIDTTGIGYAVYDMLKRLLGDKAHILYGLNFSSKERDEMFFKLRQLIEDEQILLLDDSELRSEFLSYTVSQRKDGTLHIKKRKKAHDDITDALALAVWGVFKGGIKYSFLRSISVDDLVRKVVTRWG